MQMSYDKNWRICEGQFTKIKIENNLIEATCNPLTTSGYLITPIGLLIIP